MKRCPECGFRANDKICPLCGVKMRELAGTARQITTHVHKQSGEQCALPNRERTAPQPRPNMEKPAPKKTPKTQLPGKLLPVLVVLLFVMLRSCADLY